MIFDKIIDFEMKLDSSPSNSKESLSSGANLKSNVYLLWNQTLDGDVGAEMTKKWRKTNHLGPSLRCRCAMFTGGIPSFYASIDWESPVHHAHIW